MKRDWSIIREILLKLEAATTPNTYLNAKDLIEHPMQAVAYNMRLLDQAGYIKARILESSSGNGEINAATAIHMTDKGHELLDTMRNDGVWLKIKDKFAEKGLDMTFDLVVGVGKRIMESLLS
jgi:hypothetical protein